MPDEQPTQQQPDAAPPAKAIATLPVAVPAASPGNLPRVTVEQLMAFPDADKAAAWISAIVEVEVARQAYAQQRALARDFALSGQFEDLKGATAEQGIATAVVKMQLGTAWGFNPADSMRYLYFANGKPAVENEIVAAKLQQAGYQWDIEWLEDEQQHKGKPWRRCVGCTLWLKRWNGTIYAPMLDRNGKQVSVSFTEGDADHAMIWEKGKQIPLSQKWNFVSWARDMYYWRAIARVKKYHAPHVLRGAVSKEEALDIIPAGSPPDMLPLELQAPEVAQGGPPAEIQMPDPAAAPAPPKTRLRDKVMGQAASKGGLLDDDLPLEEEPAQ